MISRILLYFIILFNLKVVAQEAKLNIIPTPFKTQPLLGNYKLKTGMPVNFSGVSSDKEKLLAFARSLIADEFFIESLNSKIDSGLTLVLDKTLNIKDEGYLLTVKSSGIFIKSNTEKGIFYGLQTLIQLMPDTVANGIPFLHIEDYPRYSYRGLHLDVGRHLFPVSFIKSYIDLIAAYKLNTFHWHLTEDQGWRIEIKKYPKLTSVGGYREETLIGNSRNKPWQFDGESYGGYYTQEEIKEVVAYAESKYVTVIPEIELPGHSMAALSAYPELACGDNPGPFKATGAWGVFDDVYCAGKENTFRFLEDVLIEVMELFPSKYIHIGGDECPKTKWKSCSYCQKRIAKLKLEDEHELQSYFIQRIEKFLNKKGRQIIGWDEILEGGLAKNATVMSWRGTKGGIAAAKQKHDVIMTPGTYLYFDRRESISKEEPQTIGHLLPLKKVYDYDPTPVELSLEEQKYIKGIQANVWTEYMKTPEKVMYMVLPRIYALSEIAWTALPNKDWKEFSENKVPEHLSNVDRKGGFYRVPEPIGAKDTTLYAESYMIDFKSPVKGAKIYYTINGYTPYQTDYFLEKPVAIRVPLGEERTLKSVVITPSGKRSVVISTVVKNKRE